MKSDYEPPATDKDGFNCPHCNAYAHHHWQKINWRKRAGSVQVENGMMSRCQRCGRYSLWADDEMVFPKKSPAPLPHEDMPDEIQQDFEEARLVVEESPRAAAALLRLAIEKLARRLTGDDDQYLHTQIGTLVEEGAIDERVQKALDAVRVIGNESVHPGQLDVDDTRETALILFELVNTIVDLTIARERTIDETFSNLSEDQLKGIENRDS